MRKNKIITMFIFIVLGMAIFTVIKLTQNSTKTLWEPRYVSVGIKGEGVYPYPLMFRKGTTVSEIKNRFNIPYQQIYNKGKEANEQTKIFKDISFKTAKK